MSHPPKRASHRNPSKSRRCRSMPCSHPLVWLAFPAIRSSPQNPLGARTNRIQGGPEFRRNPRIRRVLEHANALAVLDLPTNLATELKVVSLIVDRPRSIGLHQNAMIGGSD